MYVLIFLAKGKLPWKANTKAENKQYDRILKEKMMIDIKELCMNLPREFIIIMEYVRNMHYTATIDYDYIQYNFEQMLRTFDLVNDSIFDWHI